MKAFIFIFILSSSCSILNKRIVHDDGKQILSFYSSDSKILYTAGIVDSKNFSFLKEYKNNKLKGEKVFPGLLFYMKIIDNEIFGLLSTEDGSTKLVKLNDLNNYIIHDFQFNFEIYSGAFDITKKLDKLFVHHLSDTSLVEYEILGEKDRLEVYEDIDINNLLGFTKVKDSLYIIQNIGSILRLGVKDYYKNDVTELITFTTKFSDFKIQMKFIDSVCIIICTSSNFQSEIWKYSLKDRSLEYVESVLPIRDIIIKNKKYYATYLNSFKLNNESTSVKEIKTWKVSPF